MYEKVVGYLFYLRLFQNAPRTLFQWPRINPDFFFRENSPEDLEYAIKNNQYNDDKPQNRLIMTHIKDKQLIKWINNPVNIEYILFAKKVADLGVDPEFILNEFVLKIFKNKENNGDKNLL